MLSLRSGSTKAWRSRAGRVVLAALMIVGALVVPSQASSHGLDGSNFESKDGNTAAGLTHIDWDNASPTPTVKSDKPTGSTDDSFGQGTKEDTAAPIIVDGSIPPNKSDLKHFGAYTESAGNSKFLHLLWTRVQDPSGTTNMDFELNQLSCQQDPANCTANGVTPKRTAGDLLIMYDLSNGGTVATISLRRWLATGSWGQVLTLSQTLATGSINNSATPISSTLLDGQFSTRTFGEASVNLAAIFTGGGCQSFGSAYLKSRSSDSFTAALKDFIAPTPVNITNCGSIKIVKKDDAQNPLPGAGFTVYRDNAPLGGSKGSEDTSVGTCTTTLNQAQTEASCTVSNLSFADYWVVETTVPTGYTKAPDQYVTLTASSPSPVVLNFTDNRNPASMTVKKQDDTGAPMSGITFQLYADNNGQQGSAISGKTCTTASTGLCTISNILPAGTYWVQETNVPSTHTAAAAQSFTVALGESKSLTSTPFVNARKPSSVLIEKVDDTGAPMGGIMFQLYTDDNGVLGTAVSGKSCTTATATTTTTTIGRCTITGILPTSGNSATWWVKEETSLPGYTVAAPKTFTLGLNETKNLTGSDKFVNTRKPSAIRIQKTDDAGVPMGGITFALYSDVNNSPGTAIPGKTCTTDTVTDPAVPGSQEGYCTISDILPTTGTTGTYWVLETNTPAGYDAADPRKVTLGLDETKYLTGNDKFVNDRLFKVITIVCKEADNSLYQSSVTFDGVTKQSLASGATLPQDVTAAKLCELGGAAFGGKKASNTAKTGSVTISP